MFMAKVREGSPGGRKQWNYTELGFVKQVGFKPWVKEWGSNEWGEWWGESEEEELVGEGIGELENEGNKGTIKWSPWK